MDNVDAMGHTSPEISQSNLKHHKSSRLVSITKSL